MVTIETGNRVWKKESRSLWDAGVMETFWDKTDILVHAWPIKGTAVIWNSVNKCAEKILYPRSMFLSHFRFQSKRSLNAPPIAIFLLVLRLLSDRNMPLSLAIIQEAKYVFMKMALKAFIWKNNIFLLPCYEILRVSYGKYS